MARTQRSQRWNTGSIPVGATKNKLVSLSGAILFFRESNPGKGPGKREFSRSGWIETAGFQRAPSLPRGEGSRNPPVADDGFPLGLQS